MYAFLYYYFWEKWDKVIRLLIALIFVIEVVLLKKQGLLKTMFIETIS
jgi:hypothetical protein